MSGISIWQHRDLAALGFSGIESLIAVGFFNSVIFISSALPEFLCNCASRRESRENFSVHFNRIIIQWCSSFDEHREYCRVESRRDLDKSPDVGGHEYICNRKADWNVTVAPLLLSTIFAGPTTILPTDSRVTLVGARIVEVQYVSFTKGNYALLSARIFYS